MACLHGEMSSDLLSVVPLTVAFLTFSLDDVSIAHRGRPTVVVRCQNHAPMLAIAKKFLCEFVWGPWLFMSSSVLYLEIFPNPKL